MTDYLRVGVVTSPHGVRGEVRVFPTTEDPARFRDLEKVYLDLRGHYAERKVSGVKFHKNMVILKLEGIDSMDDAELYRNVELYVSREDAIPLGEGEYYVADLLGLDVITDEGNRLGRLKDIMETGANDVYVVDSEEYGEVLIPSIAQCILEKNPEEGYIRVHLLDGLLPEKRRNR